jgi:hypothetical protein
MNFSFKEESTTKLSQQDIVSHDMFLGCHAETRLQLQAGEESRLGVRTGGQSDVTTEQTVRFDDVAPNTTYEVVGGMDPTANMQDSRNDDLQEFFGRPVKILTIQLPLNLKYATRFNPWQLFFQNPRVINRVANYHLLKCKLRVKFLINGNPFYYGRYMASYLPLAEEDAYDDLLAFTGSNTNELMLRSQRPRIFIDPTMSQGGEFVLPFFYDGNNMVVSEVSNNWNRMGQIILESMVDLRHANGGTDDITMSVMVHAEDVVLSVPTSVDPDGLSPQSEGEDVLQLQADEADVVSPNAGVISRPASAVATWAARGATWVPAIAPYAMATSYVADAVSGIARIFGWSRPKVSTDVAQAVAPIFGGNLCNTDVAENVVSLGLDSKNEVTIDPRVTGLGHTDEMTVSHIVGHESLIARFPWALTDGPETSLGQIRVDPFIVGSNPANVFMSSCAYAALPFHYWTGSLTYRIQVVCSAYHKGRLRIVYDPNYLQHSEYNVNYMRIVDISEVRDFTVTIPMCQKTQYRLRGDITSEMIAGKGINLNPATWMSNGVLGIYVVNSLTAPAATSPDIRILVSLKGEPDLQFANPSRDVASLKLLVDPVTLQEQGLEEDAEHDDAQEPFKEGVDMLTVPNANEERLNTVFMGETFRSFRALAKRYNHYMSIGLPTSTSPSAYHLLTARLPRYPLNRGAVPGAIHSTGSFPYNYTTNTLLNYLTYGYVGWRGTIRYKALYYGDRSDGNIMAMSRDYESGVGAIVTTSIHPIGSTVGMQQSYIAYQGKSTFPSGHSGATWTNVGANPSLEIEYPYYSEYRFEPCRRLDRSTAGFTDKYPEVFILNVRSKPSDQVNTVDLAVAGGDDFSTFFYVGPPPLVWDPLDPTPT